MTYSLNKSARTTPAENIVQLDAGAQKEFINKYFSLSEHLNSLAANPRSCNLVDAHKNILGKQNYCQDLSFRFWVWEFPDTGLRIYVNNTKGICLEVVDGLSLEDTMYALRDYFERMGV